MRIGNLGKWWVILLPMLIAASAAEASNVINMSTRAYLEAAGPPLHAGMVVRGESPKTLVVRVRGPSLPIPSKMPNPALRVFDADGVLIDENDDWMTHPSAPILVKNDLAPTNPLEPAIAMTVAPGPYTAVAYSADGASGEVLISATDPQLPEAARVINFSTRAYVDNVRSPAHGGLVIHGQGREHVVIRAKGPSLPLLDAMPDPMFPVYDSNLRVLDANNDWMSHETAGLMDDTDLAPSDPREPAVALSLLPGRYTAVVEAADGHAGEAVVSVTEIPAGTAFDYWATCARPPEGSSFGKLFGVGESAEGVLIIAAEQWGVVLPPLTNDVFLTKFTRDGQLLWADWLPDPQFNPNNVLIATRHVLPLIDGSVITTGAAFILTPDPYDHDFSTDIFLARFDAEGGVEWSRRFEMEHSQSGRDVESLSDGGFIILGGEFNLDEGRSACRVIRTDANANINWSRNYVLDDEVSGCSHIDKTTDGGFLLLGDRDLSRLDADGNLLWAKEYDLGERLGARTVGLRDVGEMQDGGFLLAGADHDPVGLYLLKTDSVGVGQWAKLMRTFPDGEPVPDGYDTSILQIDDNGFLFAVADSFVRTDVEGNVIWHRTYPDSFPGGPAMRLSDGTFFVSDRINEPEYMPMADLCGMKIDIAQ